MKICVRSYIHGFLLCSFVSINEAIIREFNNRWSGAGVVGVEGQCGNEIFHFWAVWLVLRAMLFHTFDEKDKRERNKLGRRKMTF